MSAGVSSGDFNARAERTSAASQIAQTSPGPPTSFELARKFASLNSCPVPPGAAQGAVKALVQKYFAFQKFGFAVYVRLSRLKHEGRIAVVTKREAECGGREGAVRRAASTRTAKSCGPGAPKARR